MRVHWLHPASSADLQQQIRRRQENRFSPIEEIWLEWRNRSFIKGIDLGFPLSWVVPFEEFASWSRVPEELASHSLIIWCQGHETEWPASTFFFHRELKGKFKVILYPEAKRDFTLFFDYMPYWLFAEFYVHFPRWEPARPNRLTVTEAGELFEKLKELVPGLFIKAYPGLLDWNDGDRPPTWTRISPSDSTGPKVTVAVMADSHTDDIGETFRSLATQDVANAVEVIVLTGAEDPAAIDRIREMAEECPSLSVSLFAGANVYESAASAKNLAVRHASSEIVAYVDAGTLLPSHFASWVSSEIGQRPAMQCSFASERADFWRDVRDDGLIVSVELLRKVGGFKPCYRRREFQAMDLAYELNDVGSGIFFAPEMRLESSRKERAELRVDPVTREDARQFVLLHPRPDAFSSLMLFLERTSWWSRLRERFFERRDQRLTISIQR